MSPRSDLRRRHSRPSRPQLLIAYELAGESSSLPTSPSANGEGLTPITAGDNNPSASNRLATTGGIIPLRWAAIIRRNPWRHYPVTPGRLPSTRQSRDNARPLHMFKRTIAIRDDGLQTLTILGGRKDTDGLSHADRLAHPPASVNHPTESSDCVSALGESMRQDVSEEDDDHNGGKLDNLCFRCGMCCNGYMFSKVAVEPEVVARLEAGGFKITKEEKGFRFSQPCTAYKGSRCSVYGYRPYTCRAFKCKLLNKYIEATISLNEAVAIIDKTYLIIAELEDRELYKELASENRRVFTVRDKLRSKILEYSDGCFDRAYGELALLLFTAHQACEFIRDNFLPNRKEQDDALEEAALRQKQNHMLK